VDANGARALSARIEQHQHWREASAVRDGRQPSTDPDAGILVGIVGGVRLYADGLEKRLVDGAWVVSAASRTG
jgi:hypothetical protein